MTAIAIDGVVKRYGTATALDGVTIAIAERQFVALVGLSGSGKSTLLKTINALVRPDAGRVTVAGQDAADRVRLRRAIGYVFQHVGLMPHMTVAENIALGGRIAGSAVDVPALLDLVGLPARSRRGCRRRCPAGRRSGWGWRARWRRRPGCC